jgi:hypothetical protein
MTPAPPPDPAAFAVAAPQVRYGFADAWLAESLADWRASRPDRARADCRPGGGPRVVVCRGADQPLGATYAARDLTFVFIDDRLAQIRFRTSIDGFDFVTAALKRAAGLPDRIDRDTLGSTGRPHLSMIWRNGRSTIVLDDPLAGAVNLGVRLTVDALAAEVPKSG